MELQLDEMVWRWDLERQENGDGDAKVDLGLPVVECLACNVIDPVFISTKPVASTVVAILLTEEVGLGGAPSLAVSRRHAKVMMESCKALQ